MKRYHHFGLPAPDQKTPIDGELWLEGGRLWITNPNRHPQRVEWLRYAPDHAGTEESRAQPHICYEVDDVGSAIAGKEVLTPVGQMGNPPFALVAFTMEDGIKVEYIQITGARQWFDDPVEP